MDFKLYTIYVISVFTVAVSMVTGRATLTLSLMKYEAKDANCGNWLSRETCDPEFKICLSETSGRQRCASIFRVDDSTSIDFTRREPHTFPFSLETLGVDLTITIRVEDMDSINANDAMDTLTKGFDSVQRTDHPDVVKFSGTNKKFGIKLTATVSITCDADYYGPACDTFCNNSAISHTCSADGQPVCRQGYAKTITGICVLPSTTTAATTSTTTTTSTAKQTTLTTLSSTTSTRRHNATLPPTTSNLTTDQHRTISTTSKLHRNTPDSWTATPISSSYVSQVLNTSSQAPSVSVRDTSTTPSTTLKTPNSTEDSSGLNISESTIAPDVTQVSPSQTTNNLTTFKHRTISTTSKLHRNTPDSWTATPISSSYVSQVLNTSSQAPSVSERDASTTPSTTLKTPNSTEDSSGLNISESTIVPDVTRVSPSQTLEGNTLSKETTTSRLSLSTENYTPQTPTKVAITVKPVTAPVTSAQSENTQESYSLDTSPMSQTSSPLLSEKTSVSHVGLSTTAGYSTGEQTSEVISQTARTVTLSSSGYTNNLNIGNRNATSTNTFPTSDSSTDKNSPSVTNSSFQATATTSNVVGNATTDYVPTFSNEPFSTSGAASLENATETVVSLTRSSVKIPDSTTPTPKPLSYKSDTTSSYPHPTTSRSPSTTMWKGKTSTSTIPPVSTFTTGSAQNTSESPNAPTTSDNALAKFTSPNSNSTQEIHNYTQKTSVSVSSTPSTNGTVPSAKVIKTETVPTTTLSSSDLTSSLFSNSGTDITTLSSSMSSSTSYLQSRDTVTSDKPRTTSSNISGKTSIASDRTKLSTVLLSTSNTDKPITTHQPLVSTHLSLASSTTISHSTPSKFSFSKVSNTKVTTDSSLTVTSSTSPSASSISINTSSTSSRKATINSGTSSTVSHVSKTNSPKSSRKATIHPSLVTTKSSELSSVGSSEPTVSTATLLKTTSDSKRPETNGSSTIKNKATDSDQNTAGDSWVKRHEAVFAVCLAIGVMVILAAVVVICKLRKREDNTDHFQKGYDAWHKREESSYPMDAISTTNGVNRGFEHEQFRTNGNAFDRHL